MFLGMFLLVKLCPLCSKEQVNRVNIVATEMLILTK